MGDEIGEECGVGAIYLKDQSKSCLETPFNLVHLASKMQHRGQRSAGINVYNPYGNSPLVSHKDIGLVAEVFRMRNKEEFEEILKRCQGTAGITHTRYSTSGKRRDYEAMRNEVQPFERRHGRLSKRFSLAFNGNLTNYEELFDELKATGYWMDTKVDTEVLMHYMALYTKKLSEGLEHGKSPDKFEMVRKIMEKFDGAYNVLSMFADGELIAFRDPRGFHPLSIGENDKMYAIASETSALESVGINNFSTILPGEAIRINKNGIERKRLVSGISSCLCQLEPVYFMRADSELDGVEVRAMRRALGVRLAEDEPLKGKLDDSYIVVPAPKAAIPGGEGFADKLGLRFSLAIDKAEDLRGFINDEEERKDIMSTVYIVYRNAVKGKKVIVVDDSTVRGETSRQLVSYLRKKGAVEVHLRLTEPPIKHPCWYGIDYPTRKELIANISKDNLEAEIAKAIGADSVHFQTIDGLVEALGIPRDNLCLACLTGKYPTHCGQKKA